MTAKITLMHHYSLVQMKYVEQYILELNLSIYSKAYFIAQYEINEEEPIKMYEEQLKMIERLKTT
jgi:hypothetical protein